MKLKLKGNDFIFIIEVFTEKIINALNEMKSLLKGNGKVIITSSENLEGLEW